MPCDKHLYSVTGCLACADYDLRHPREDIRGHQPRGVSENTPGRGYDEEDAPGNEEGA